MGAWKRFYSGCTPGVCRASYCSKRSLFVIFSIFPFCATGGFATNLVPKLATVKVAATTAVTPTPAFHNADIVCRRPAKNLPIFFSRYNNVYHRQAQQKCIPSYHTSWRALLKPE